MMFPRRLDSHRIAPLLCLDIYWHVKRVTEVYLVHTRMMYDEY